MSASILGSLLMLLSGCAMFEGWNSTGSASDSSQTTQYSYLEDQLKRLTERVAGLEQSNANLQRDLTDLQTRLGQLQSGASSQVSAAELQQLRTQVQQLQIQQEKEKQAILDQLAKEIAGLAASKRATRPTADTGTADVGYEYTVKQGDTLAALSKLYGVSVAAIKKANNLSNDTLRVGQKLFIPKPPS
jgi:LysM repeat protein